MKHKKTGGCLCGKCRYEVESENLSSGACHCDMCRRWSGSMVMAYHGEVTITEDATLEWYHSSDWGKRGFCRECGGNLFWAMQDGSMTVAMAGTLDDVSDLMFDSEIFIDQKPDFYDFKNATKKQTEAEVLAQFSNGS